jgi:hypothetical protein
MEKSPSVSSRPDVESAWGYSLELAVCDQCGWSFLVPADRASHRCPHCFKVDLSLEDLQPALDQGLPYHHPPELALPFTLTSEILAARVNSFSQGIPYPSADLSPANLTGRLQRILIPAWLVDTCVRASWQAEVGFDYEVVSHQDQYRESQGGWKTQQVTETRVRWEPRLGRLERAYQNLPITALEGVHQLRESLGDIRLDGAQPYTPELTQGAFVRLPARSREDAWGEALPKLQSAAAEECRQAASADHLRDFRWQPDFYGQNWTLLLLPWYATYYLDDENQPQPVYLHGQSGVVRGERWASLKRARKAAFIILGVAGLIGLLSLLLVAAGLLVPPLLVIGAIGLFIALLVGLGAIIPPAIAWQFNRSQKLFP